MLMMVPAPSLQQIGERDPDMFRRLGDLANQGFDVAVRVAAESLIPVSSRRIAAVLIRVSAVDAPDTGLAQPNVMISQGQLAEMSNVSRNLASSTLSHFRAAGWIETHYNRIRIIDAPALAGFAYSDN